ncbi:MAG: hypothetical protein P1U32_03240 [Legionellaceae bacterium]|nr:hypothetical protein [Legionellaceae bacterium]
MVQSKTLMLPEGYVIRKLSKLEQFKDSPDALRDIFRQSVDKNIDFAYKVIQYLSTPLGVRMLLLLEKLHGE